MNQISSQKWKILSTRFLEKLIYFYILSLLIFMQIGKIAQIKRSKVAFSKIEQSKLNNQISWNWLMFRVADQISKEKFEVDQFV